MKEKIEAGLKQAYPQLGLDDETFEGVAAAAETFIKDEADIPNFVKGAEKMLKRYQSIADVARGEASRAKKELEDLKAKATAQPQPTPKAEEPKPETNPMPDFAKLISEAVSAAVKPFKDELDAMKAEGLTKTAIKDGKDLFFANKLAESYKNEAEDSWDRALEYNELSGSKMTAKELSDKAKGYFDKAVSRKGVDVQKAYESAGNPKPQYDDDKKLAAKLRGAEENKK